MIDLLSSLPGAVAQGLIWGIMAVGVYITYKLLDIADLTVDSSLCTGGATSAVLILMGMHPLLSLVFAVFAGMLAGLVTGFLHTRLRIPAILAGILTQLGLYSINLRIMGKTPNIPLTKSETIYKIADRLLPPQYAGMVLNLVLLAVIIGISLIRFFTRSKAAQGLRKVPVLRVLATPKGTMAVLLGSIIYKFCVQIAINAGLPANMLKFITAALFLLVLVIAGRKGEEIIHA